MIKNILRSKWHPGIFRWPMVAIFLFLIYNLLFDVPFTRSNLGLSLTWYVWWPILPVLFLMAGRSWCAVCPFATVSDLIQRLVGIRMHIPLYIKRYGIWICFSLFILLIYVEFLAGIIFSTSATAILLLTFTTSVVFFGAFFKGRAWCRYLCPLGGIAGIFSRLSSLTLQCDRQKCATCKTIACYQGGENAPACPMFICARTGNNLVHCNFCGNCIKNCPNDSISISSKMPLKGLLSIQKPKFEESFVSAVFLGIVLFQNLFLKHQQKITGFFGIENFNLSIATSYTLVLALPVVMLYLTSYFASRINSESVKKNFTRYGYFLIPIVFVNQAGLTTIHEFLGNGQLAVFNLLPFFGVRKPNATAALARDNLIHSLEFMLLAAGFMATIFMIHRFAKLNDLKHGFRNFFTPLLVLFLFLIPIDLYIYYSPYVYSQHPTSIRDKSLKTRSAESGSLTATYNPPRPEDAPAEIKDLVMLGYNIMKDAQRYAGPYVGNTLSCSNCHFDAGITEGKVFGGLTLVGFTVRRPTAPEICKANNKCFETCMNGKPLPVDSLEMQALNAFYHWISKDIPLDAEMPWYGLEKLPGGDRIFDLRKGKQLYAEKCAACHHMDGEGSVGAPPVWGKNSYTDASSIYDNEVFAAFSYNNMPLGNPDLTVLQAHNLALFINSQPRLHYDKKR